MRPTPEQVEQSIPRSTWASSPLLVKLGGPTRFGPVVFYMCCGEKMFIILLFLIKWNGHVTSRGSYIMQNS